nr:retrovirus-related Pol polyprotein from transposon TNT 1-94 [Tanacetum cinerariifolium]
MKVEESLNVTFDESPPPPKTSPLVDDDLVKEVAIEGSEKKPLGNDIEDEILEINKLVNIKESKSHPLHNVIRNLNQKTLRSQDQEKKDYVDQKSTSGVCTLMGCCLTSWVSKKQTALAISTIEAEYVNLEKACQQALWIKQALIDYDINLD